MAQLPLSSFDMSNIFNSARFYKNGVSTKTELTLKENNKWNENYEKKFYVAVKNWQWRS